jgi:hypothetical protein
MQLFDAINCIQLRTFLRRLLASLRRLLLASQVVSVSFLLAGRVRRGCLAFQVSVNAIFVDQPNAPSLTFFLKRKALDLTPVHQLIQLRSFPRIVDYRVLDPNPSKAKRYADRECLCLNLCGC